jgi:hypothetical protein
MVGEMYGSMEIGLDKQKSSLFLLAVGGNNMGL